MSLNSSRGSAPARALLRCGWRSVLAGSWDLWHWEHHFLFKNLLGNTSAFEPMIAGSATPTQNASTPYALTMRPCWPYDDKVSYTATANGMNSSVQGAAHAAINWRADFGEIQVELRGFTGGLGRQQRGLGLLEAGFARFGVLGGNGPVGEQLPGPFGFALGVLPMDFGLLVLGLAAIKLSLMPARIDHEKHRAFLDQLAGLKTDFLNVTGDARPHLDPLDGFGAPGEFVPFDKFLLFDGCDGYGGRRWLLLGGASSAASGQERQSAEQKCRRGETKKWLECHSVGDLGCGFGRSRRSAAISRRAQVRD